jgi:hypothetical protein
MCLVVPVGLRVAESTDVLINPEDTILLQDGDSVLVLAEDNDTYSPDGLSDVPHNDILDPCTSIPQGSSDSDVTSLDTRAEAQLSGSFSDAMEKVLFIGWRRDIEGSDASECKLYNPTAWPVDMTVEIDNYVAFGSELAPSAAP